MFESSFKPIWRYPNEGELSKTMSNHKIKQKLLSSENLRNRKQFQSNKRNLKKKKLVFFTT